MLSGSSPSQGLKRVNILRIATLLAICLTSDRRVVAAQKVGDASLPERLEQIASSYTADNAFMGSVLVARGNKILLSKGYGNANLEQNIPNDPDTKFRIGSLTKQFTAALVLLLQQDGKLRIEDPVRKYLPDAPKSWDKITLTELLEHNSGIPEIQSDPRFRSWAMSPHTHAEEIALFKDRPLNFEPGSKHEYSNSNYLVLGAVIEKVTGQDYGTQLRNRIFKPLGMNDSGVDKDGLVLPKRAKGYMNDNGRLVPAPSESMSVPWSAGSIYSTANDLLRWERGLFGGKVLSQPSFKAMTTSGKGSYGFGVAVKTEDGMKVVDHNGAIEGFVAHLAYVPEPHIAVIVLSNVFGGAPPAMGNQLVEAMLGKTVVLARERKAVPISNADLARFAGTYQMSSGMAFTFTIKGNSLELNAGGEMTSLLYQGINAGHPSFYVAMTNGEIEFVSDPSGAITTVLWHQYENEQTGKRP
jgi:CubicO group peptidase (beta-lactamase class C family)